ncbi:uncharacterized protein [Hyperolius riggenbachi]|uniref:uncharacterized protein n=1 Tax=Hyperolius riggenbachi TaxID=752182 RepID=UPI0035A2A3D5
MEEDQSHMTTSLRMEEDQSHVITSLRMEEDQSHMTERIFNLTLKIICLLPGESFPPVKSGDHMTITVPPPHFLISEGHNKQKILEITRKMMELLTEEVSMRCPDVAIYFSVEEWQYIEQHQDLYKDAMMESQPHLTSPDDKHIDVSSNRNPPERCTGPLYSQDCPQEDPTIRDQAAASCTDHMTTSLRMEEDQSHMTERIFNLTLEIICLLTGERFSPVKSGDHLTILVPRSQSLIFGKDYKQKMLEIIRKMIELLTGEVLIRCQDVAIYFSMEEWQYIEHNDLYKDAMMESQPPLTSPAHMLQCLHSDPRVKQMRAREDIWITLMLDPRLKGSWLSSCLEEETRCAE